MNLEFNKSDVSFNEVPETKANWFCENYATAVEVLEAAKGFFKNPIAKMVISIAIGAINLVGQSICRNK